MHSGSQQLSSLHEELTTLLSQYDVNEAAASVKVYAIKPLGGGVALVLWPDLLLLKSACMRPLSSPWYPVQMASQAWASALAARPERKEHV